MKSKLTLMLTLLTALSLVVSLSAHADATTDSAITSILNLFSKGLGMTRTFEGRTPKGRPCKGTVYGMSPLDRSGYVAFGVQVDDGNAAFEAILNGSYGGPIARVHQLMVTAGYVSFQFTPKRIGEVFAPITVQIFRKPDGSLSQVSVRQFRGNFETSSVTCIVSKDSGL